MQESNGWQLQRYKGIKRHNPCSTGFYLTKFMAIPENGLLCFVIDESEFVIYHQNLQQTSAKFGKKQYIFFFLLSAVKSWKMEIR